MFLGRLEVDSIDRKNLQKCHPTDAGHFHRTTRTHIEELLSVNGRRKFNALIRGPERGPFSTHRILGEMGEHLRHSRIESLGLGQ